MTSLDLMFYIFKKYYDFLFSSYIESGVSIGWVIIVSMVMGIVIRGLFNVPSGLSFRGKTEPKTAPITYNIYRRDGKGKE